MINLRLIVYKLVVTGGKDVKVNQKVYHLTTN